MWSKDMICVQYRHVNHQQQATVHNQLTAVAAFIDDSSYVLTRTHRHNDEHTFIHTRLEIRTNPNAAQLVSSSSSSDQQVPLSMTHPTLLQPSFLSFLPHYLGRKHSVGY